MKDEPRNASAMAGRIIRAGHSNKNSIPDCCQPLHKRRSPQCANHNPDCGSLTTRAKERGSHPFPSCPGFCAEERFFRRTKLHQEKQNIAHLDTTYANYDSRSVPREESLRLPSSELVLSTIPRVSPTEPCKNSADIKTLRAAHGRPCPKTAANNSRRGRRPRPRPTRRAPHPQPKRCGARPACQSLSLGNAGSIDANGSPEDAEWP